MTVKVVSGAETTVENTASVQIGEDGPTVSTNTESTEIDESERSIIITPADIIVYTGGTGYESVVGNQSGAAGRERMRKRVSRATACLSLATISRCPIGSTTN